MAPEGLQPRGAKMGRLTSVEEEATDHHPHPQPPPPSSSETDSTTDEPKRHISSSKTLLIMCIWLWLLCFTCLIIITVWSNIRCRELDVDATTGTQDVEHTHGAHFRVRNTVLATSLCLCVLYLVLSVVAYRNIHFLLAHLDMDLNSVAHFFSLVGGALLVVAPYAHDEDGVVQELATREDGTTSSIEECRAVEVEIRRAHQHLREYQKLLPLSVRDAMGPDGVSGSEEDGDGAEVVREEQQSSTCGSVAVGTAVPQTCYAPALMMASDLQSVGGGYAASQRRGSDASRSVASQWSESRARRRRRSHSVVLGRSLGLRIQSCTALLVAFGGLYEAACQSSAMAAAASNIFLNCIMAMSRKHRGRAVYYEPDRVLLWWGGRAVEGRGGHRHAALACAVELCAELPRLAGPFESLQRRGVLHPAVMVGHSCFALSGTVGQEEKHHFVQCSGMGLMQSAIALCGHLHIKLGWIDEVPPSVAHRHPIQVLPADLIHDLRGEEHTLYDLHLHAGLGPLDHTRQEAVLAAFECFRCGDYEGCRKGLAPWSASSQTWAHPLVERLYQISKLFLASESKYSRCVPQWRCFGAGGSPNNATLAATPSRSPRPSLQDLVAELRSPPGTPSCCGSRPRSTSPTWRNPSAAMNSLRLEIQHATQPTTTTTTTNANNTSSAGMASAATRDFTDRQGLRYRLSVRSLGSTPTSDVYLGLSYDGGLVAVKVVPLMRGQMEMSELTKRRLRRKGMAVQADAEAAVKGVISEVELLSQLRHACIVGYITSAVDRGQLLLVMEYVSGGSLLHLLSQYTNLPLHRATACLRDVLAGLHYLHGKGIAHRDVKPQNVLVPANGRCKLADFGISLQISLASGEAHFEGTPFYMAPEAARGEVTVKSDIWSFGIMMAEVLTGLLPWPEDMSALSLKYRLAHDETLTPVIRGALPPEAHELLQWCLQRRPADRPSAKTLLSTAFFSPRGTSHSQRHLDELR